MHLANTHTDSQCCVFTFFSSDMCWVTLPSPLLPNGPNKKNDKHKNASSLATNKKEVNILLKCPDDVGEWMWDEQPLRISDRTSSVAVVAAVVAVLFIHSAHSAAATFDLFIASEIRWRCMGPPLHTIYNIRRWSVAPFSIRSKTRDEKFAHLMTSSFIVSL